MTEAKKGFNYATEHIKSLILGRIKEYKYKLRLAKKYTSTINEAEVKIRIKELRDVLKDCF